MGSMFMLGFSWWYFSPSFLVSLPLAMICEAITENDKCFDVLQVDYLSDMVSR